MSRFHPVRQLFILALLMLSSTVSAFSQVDVGKLTAALSGRAVISTIAVGYMGMNSGDVFDKPAGTVIYPDNQVGTPRVEFVSRVGMSLFDSLILVTHSQFNPGSRFNVGKVNIKGDNLEIALISNPDTEKMAVAKFVLGRNWQATMTVDSVLALVYKFFAPDQAPASPTDIVVTEEGPGASGANGDAVLSTDELPPAKAIKEQNRLQGLISFADGHGQTGMLPNFLNQLGFLYLGTSENQKAVQAFVRALSIADQVRDGKQAARAQYGLGISYGRLGELGKAIDFGKQSVQAEEQLGNKAGEAGALANLGATYNASGDYAESIQSSTQALAVLEKTHFVLGANVDKAGIMANLGLSYVRMGDQKKALDYLNQAEPILSHAGNKHNDGICLGVIGFSYSKLGDDKTALQYYSRAIPLVHEAGDRASEAYGLSLAGVSYVRTGNSQEAIKSLGQALTLAKSVRDPLLEAWVLDGLLIAYKAQQPALAIYFGKQSVDLLQHTRRNLQTTDPAVSSAFVSANSDSYHHLIDLLVAQNRLPEAQETLEMLKNQEYNDYVRGLPAQGVGPSLTPAEIQAKNDYQQATSQIVALGDKLATLKAIPERTPREEQEYQQDSDQLEQANQGLNSYYARMYELFGKSGAANKQVAEVRGNLASLREQLAKTPFAVALYTIVTQDRLIVIASTGTATVAREYPIGAEELNRKIDAFRRVLRDPNADPQPAGEDLYKILVTPVKADLDQAHAKTLIWILDGRLRYVPMDALYDGKQYLIENYGSVSILPASIPYLSDKPDVARMKAVAMGISRKYEEGLPALPAVARELDDVVKDPRAGAPGGVLPGTILLDGQFTEKAMEDQLDGQHAVVHIASHFVFKPGDDNNSYLLLAGKEESGQGFHLTIADFRDNPRLALDGTALLTLSACETGIGGDASDGREVDGLSTTAQLKGARAVISTLWSVNDTSTGQLMGDFYRRWTDGAGKLEKIEALRQAQLDLLLGQIRGSNANDRGFMAVKVGTSGTAGYSHPYYWAPFVLTGNWR